VFAVKLANLLMFTVCGENTVKCLESFRESPKVFYRCHFLSALRKNGHKITHGFRAHAQIKGAVVSLFDPCATTSFLAGEYWGP